ncbi:MAG: hypothetical protein IKZ87_01215 [Actinomycetaceae bacterium]|nr:hypothetical protein [Actinomycetaceae bacterium]
METQKEWSFYAFVGMWIAFAVAVTVKAVSLVIGAVDIVGGVVSIDVREVAGAVFLMISGAIAVFLAWDSFGSWPEPN